MSEANAITWSMSGSLPNPAAPGSAPWGTVDGGLLEVAAVVVSRFADANTALDFMQ